MRSRLILAAALAATALPAPDAAAQDDDEAVPELEDQTERCIFSRSIRRTEAIDDSTIAFFLSGGRTYVNTLLNDCAGLRRHNRFAYETSGGRLCRLDRIAVLYTSTGAQSGATCALGEFHLMEEETVEILLEAAENRGGALPVSAGPVELPPEEESEATTTPADD